MMTVNTSNKTVLRTLIINDWFSTEIFRLSTPADEDLEGGEELDWQGRIFMRIFQRVRTERRPLLYSLGFTRTPGETRFGAKDFWWRDSPGASGEGWAAGFGGESNTRESKAELHGGHHYLQPTRENRFYAIIFRYGFAKNVRREKTCRERRDLRRGKPEAA